MTAFEVGWSVLKAPFVVQGGDYMHYAGVGDSQPTEYLYSGAKHGDDPSGYWTSGLGHAMHFAMEGDEYGCLSDDLRQGEPIVFRAKADGFVRVPADIEMYNSEDFPIAWFEPGRTEHVPHDRIEYDVLRGAELADALADWASGWTRGPLSLGGFEIGELLERLRDPEHQWPETNDLGDRSDYFKERRELQEQFWDENRKVEQ